MVNIATRDFMQYGAVGDGIVDDTAAIQSALNAVDGSGNPYPFTGSGRLFKVTDHLTCHPGTYIENARFINYDTTVATARTLVMDDPGGTFTLVNVYIDLNKATGEGDVTSMMGISVADADEVDFTNVEVTGNGHGRAINIIGTGQTKVRLTGCYIHDMMFTDMTAPSSEQIYGINIELCDDVIIRDLRIDHLYCSIGGGPQRNYQTDGVHIGTCNNVTIEDSYISRVMEGIDLAGTDPFRSVSFINVRTEDCDAYGIKVVHCAKDVSVIGCQDKGAGIAGFFVGAGSVQAEMGPKNIQFVNCTARDPGNNSGWGVTVVRSGFRVMPGNGGTAPWAPQKVMFTGCSAISVAPIPDSIPPFVSHMDYGFQVDNATPATDPYTGDLVGEVQIRGYVVEGATIADFANCSADTTGNMISS